MNIIRKLNINCSLTIDFYFDGFHTNKTESQRSVCWNVFKNILTIYITDGSERCAFHYNISTNYRFLECCICNNTLNRYHSLCISANNEQ